MIGDSLRSQVGVLLASLMLASSASAQERSSALVMTLGADTVQIERFVRHGRVIEGLAVIRTPRVRLLRYVITLGDGSDWKSYSQFEVQGDGISPEIGLTPRLELTINGDTVLRAEKRRDVEVVDTTIAPRGAYPLSTIPIGAPFLPYEFALSRARLAGDGGSEPLYRIMPGRGAREPMVTRVLHASADSVRVDYFGQGDFTVVFDSSGRLLRSDWRNTTYKVTVERSEDADVSRIAARWRADEAAGRGMGAISPVDSLRGTVGSARYILTYGRPSRRGRAIWGGVVPWNRVWRLGANFATQLRIDADLLLGDSVVPAGAYSLWMVPGASSAELIVNKKANVFGTQYDARADLVRVPMRLEPSRAIVEELTIALGGGSLRIAWDDRVWSVPVSAKGSP